MNYGSESLQKAVALLADALVDIEGYTPHIVLTEYLYGICPYGDNLSKALTLSKYREGFFTAVDEVTDDEIRMARDRHKAEASYLSKEPMGALFGLFAPAVGRVLDTLAPGDNDLIDVCKKYLLPIIIPTVGSPTIAALFMGQFCDMWPRGEALQKRMEVTVLSRVTGSQN